MHPPVVLIGNDPSMIDSASESVARMVAYTQLYAQVDVRVFVGAAGSNSTYSPAERLRIHTVAGSRLWGVIALAVGAHKDAVAFGAKAIIAQDAFVFGAIALLVGKLRKIPVVVGIYGTDIGNAYVRTESLKRRVYAILARVVLRYADAIQTDGPETVRRLRQKYGEKVFFKPMIPQHLDTLRVDMRRREEKLRILFIGRFVPQKNIPLLLDTIEEVHTRAANEVHFTIVGDGPEHAWFVREVRHRGLQEVCEILPIVSRSEMRQLLLENDALLMVSRYEGFPRVFMEVAVAGLPIITTDVGGVAGLVENDVSGFVVPQGAQAPEIAEHLLLLRNGNTLEEMSANITKQWDALYGHKDVLEYQRPLAEYLTGRHV